MKLEEFAKIVEVMRRSQDRYKMARKRGGVPLSAMDKLREEVADEEKKVDEALTLIRNSYNKPPKLF